MCCHPLSMGNAVGPGTTAPHQVRLNIADLARRYRLFEQHRCRGYHFVQLWLAMGFHARQLRTRIGLTQSIELAGTPDFVTGPLRFTTTIYGIVPVRSIQEWGSSIVAFNFRSGVLHSIWCNTFHHASAQRLLSMQPYHNVQRFVSRNRIRGRRDLLARKT